MKRLLFKILIFIAVITMASGLGQIIAAPVILNFIGAERDRTSSHFFAIIGMFMLLFGGLLFQSLKSREINPVPVFWCGMQKFGAAVAVGLGVYNTVFSRLALGVAVFDLLSGILILMYWKKLKGGSL